MEHIRIRRKIRGKEITVICRALALVLFLVIWSCSARIRDAVIYHTLDYPAPGQESTTRIPQTLMIYRFLLDPSVESDTILMLPAQASEKPRGIHRWQENPADMITDLILRDLEQSGPFENVVDQLSNARYRYALEGTIRQLHGLMKGGKSFGCAEVEVTLTDFEAPRGIRKDLLRKSYKVEIPSRDASPDAMLESFNLGIKEISRRLRGDIMSVLTKTGER